ncbi:MAG: hypothetical protein ACETWD_03125 [Desulfatiglandales bacterium]
MSGTPRGTPFGVPLRTYVTERNVQKIGLPEKKLRMRFIFVLGRE